MLFSSFLWNLFSLWACICLKFTNNFSFLNKFGFLHDRDLCETAKKAYRNVRKKFLFFPSVVRLFCYHLQHFFLILRLARINKHNRKWNKKEIRKIYAYAIPPTKVKISRARNNIKFNSSRFRLVSVPVVSFLPFRFVFSHVQASACFPLNSVWCEFENRENYSIVTCCCEFVPNIRHKCRRQKIHHEMNDEKK